MNRRLLALIFLVACSGPISSPFSPEASTAQAQRPFTYVLEGCFRKSATCPKAGGFVQILGGGIVTDGIEHPVAIAVAPSTGRLYVGNDLEKASGSIAIYDAGRVHPQNAIPHVKGNPHAISIDGTGGVYVASQYASGCCRLRSRLAMYDPGTAKPVQVLRGVAPFASAPVFDAAGHLYVANFDVFPGWITVYAAGKAMPSRVLRDGIGFPERLAVTPDGTLFVLNRKFNHASNILVFTAGSVTPTRTIVTGLDRPLAIALDAGGDLYVANLGRRNNTGNVAVYTAGGSALARVVRNGVDRPVDLAIDSTGRLWVANSPAFGVNTVAVYARDASSPLKTYRLVQSAIGLAVTL